MNQIQIKTEFVDKTLPVVKVELGGYIDQSNSDKVEKVFNNLFMGNHYNVIFDFTPLIYMSSAGWGVFVGEVKRFREQGGDIKLANMNAEIYEIFQMLEFYHILEDYNSLEEALIAFGVEVKTDAGGNSGYREEKKSETSPATEESEKPSFYEQSTDLFEKKAVKPEKPANQAEVKQAVPAKKPVPKDDNHRDKRPKQAPLNLAYLPLQEKIRKIVAKFPLISVRQLKKMLKHEDFGRERVNYIRLYRVLRELNLDTRAKRYRYYRSC